MAILSKENRKFEKQVIDLQSPQGNAFFLLGTASRLAKQLNLDSEAVMEEMKDGDYDHLIEVFDKYFGDFIDLQQ